MEPVKGGRLVNLPEEANKIFRNLNNGSNASYAIRFAASFENVFMVLSGMSNMEQLIDNVSFMKNFKPLNEEEWEAIKDVVRILKELPTIACTSCRYCTDGCPKQISIPDLFQAYNLKIQFADINAESSYAYHTRNGGKAKDCIKCGKCEKICPQHLKIRDLLVKVSETFD